MNILQNESHNGFPVVDNYDPYAPIVRYFLIQFFLFCMKDIYIDVYEISQLRIEYITFIQIIEVNNIIFKTLRKHFFHG